MPQLRITALTDGMVLSSDATDQAGKVVLPAGAIIDTAGRNRLLMARVRKVSVRSTAPAGAKPAPKPAAATAESKSDSVVMQEQFLRLAHMFEPFRDDALMREMCRLAIKCAQERLISG